MPEDSVGTILVSQCDRHSVQPRRYETTPSMTLYAIYASGSEVRSESRNEGSRLPL